MNWKCELCNRQLEWSYLELTDNGGPICPNCDSDMTLERNPEPRGTNPSSTPSNDELQAASQTAVKSLAACPRVTEMHLDAKMPQVGCSCNGCELWRKAYAAGDYSRKLQGLPT